VASRCAPIGASYVVYFETPFSSARAWSIWSWAYVAKAAAVIVSPLWASSGRDPLSG